MLDLKLVRKDPQAVANALEKKHYSFPVSRFITLDAERKEADIRSQELLAERKKSSKQIGALIASGKSVNDAKAEVNEVLNRLSDELDQAVAQAKEIQTALDDLMMQTPNLPDGAVPAGRDEDDNEEILKWGTPAEPGSGAVTVATLSNTDMSADADASVSGGDYNIGGAVGLNIVQNDNKASIGGGADITSGDVSVTAGMRAETLEDNSTDDVNVIAADAVAGAGTGEFSLAGSVGLNLVMRNNTSAVISTDAQITASGDVAVNATAKSQYKADAKATVGMEKTIWEGIDETFSTLTDIKVWTDAAEKGFEGMLANLQDSLTSGDAGDGASDSDSAGDGDSDGGGDGGGTGVGAGISVNVIIGEDTRAAIEDNATISGTNAGVVSVTASAESDIETNAFAGAKPDEAGGEAKTSLDAAVSVGILMKDVDAYMGSGSGLTATDNVSVSATHPMGSPPPRD